MKPVILTVLALIAVAYAGPGHIHILGLENKGVNPDGSYRWSYETENQIAAEEERRLIKRLKGPETFAVGGAFRYTSPEGVPVSIVYFADENGFQAQGDSIPQPPPIPEYIQRALAWNAAHPEEEQPDRQQVYNRPAGLSPRGKFF